MVVNEPGVSTEGEGGDAGPAAQTVADIVAAGGRGHANTASVTDPTGAASIVEEAGQRFGRIDAVVNNTGHAATGQLLDLSDDDWRNGFDMLLMNVVRMARLVTPPMLARRTGSIVNVSSFGAVEPSLKFPISSALRAALGAYAKLFSQQFARSGLRMNNVLPGYIDTYPADETTLATIPAGRQGTAAEVARVVAFLASDESAYVNGQSLLVDGGLVRGL